MCKLASCWFFIALLEPLSSLPVPGSGASFQPSVPDGEPLRVLDRAALLQMLRQELAVDRGATLREADPRTDSVNPRGALGKVSCSADPGTDSVNPRGALGKALSEGGLNTRLHDLLAGTRRRYKKRGAPSECFWKYCV